MTPNEPNAIALLRQGVYVPDAADCDAILQTYDTIVAERDAAVRERDAIKANYDESVRECANVMAMRENVSSQLWDCMNERDGYRARLAACERVVELDEWRVLTKDGENPKRTWWIQHEWAVEDAAAADKEYPADAPHRIVRVALVEDPALEGPRDE
jgi:hypothetical protein